MTLNSKEIERFAEYLIGYGATIESATNPYEVLRYRLPESGVTVIYQKANGAWTLPPDARQHLKDFRAGKAIEKRRRSGGKARQRLVAKIKDRDGDTCCFCGFFLDGDETLEHFLSIKHGGNNSLANTALAHERCNQIADHLSVMEKMKLRDRLQQALALRAPWEALPSSEELRGLVGAAY